MSSSVDGRDEGAAGFDSQRTRRNSGGSASQDSSTFECNICLDTARDAVVSMCGHLFWYGIINFEILFMLTLNIQLHSKPIQAL